EGSFTAFGRMRPPNEIADLRTAGRHRMPAMMRGSDGLELALTWRQLAKLRLAGPAPTPTPAPAVIAAAAPGPQPATALTRLVAPPPVAMKSVANEELPSTRRRK